MDTIKKIFQNSFFVLKENFCASIASILFLLTIITWTIFTGGVFDGLLKNTQFKDNSFIIISVWFSLMFVFVILPCEFGIKRWFYKMAKKEHIEFKEIFYFFSSSKKYWRTVFLRVKISVLKLITMFIAIIPAVFLYFSLFDMNNVQTIAQAMLFGGIVILFLVAIMVGIGFIVYFNHRYFLVDYLYFENEDMHFDEMIKKSVKISRKKLQAVLQLYAIMWPIILLCFAIVPILVIFPFIYVSVAMKANKAYTENIEYIKK